ncbi:hypothetical protein ACHAPJ_012753 [Fusarium lateritium]
MDSLIDAGLRFDSLSSRDRLLLVGLVIVVAAYSFLTNLCTPEINKIHLVVDDDEKTGENSDRCIASQMRESGKNCVILFGSQTGTAQDYAIRLGKEAKARFGLEPLVADLEDYDIESLDDLPEGSVAMFLLATYGEGDPTDNAVDFWETLNNDASFSRGEDPPLESLKYVVFGLGNRTYEHFNAMARRVSSIFDRLGAQRIGPLGEGDDGAGTLEEDFLSWKDEMWAALSDEVRLEESNSAFQPSFSIMERGDLDTSSSEVFTGEPSKDSLGRLRQGPFDSQNPFLARVADCRELLTCKDRNCVHVELDLTQSGLKYQTGDHVAIWPINSSRQVEDLLDILGLVDKMDTVISVKSLENAPKVPFPTPTTYRLVFKHYLEICGSVSRQFMSIIASFAPDEASKVKITQLAKDRDLFNEKVIQKRHNLASILRQASQGQKWNELPFAVLLEGIPKLQPRLYSISSSSLYQPDRISVTAMVDKYAIPDREDAFRGVASNYLLSLKGHWEAKTTLIDTHEWLSKATGNPDPLDMRIPIHIRTSTFRMPSDPKAPMILVGPGTGIAPFRAFLHEQGHKAKAGQETGEILLFCGCRRRDEDYLYSAEWKECQFLLGEKLKIITAFSREESKKVYVQHRILENSKIVSRLLENGGRMYVCGDAANMARAVSNAVVDVFVQSRNITVEEGRAALKGLKTSHRYHEDVW